MTKLWFVYGKDELFGPTYLVAATEEEEVLKNSKFKRPVVEYLGTTERDLKGPIMASGW